MANELIEALEFIKQDKDSNLLSENLKTGISCLGIDGEFTGDATATSNDILIDKTAYVNGQKITGIITNYEPFTELGISNAYASDSALVVRNDSGSPVCFQPNAGFSIGSSIVASAIELTPDIIKEGSTVLGMVGTLKIGVDTTDGTATPDDIALSKVAYVSGNRLVGTIPTHNNESILVADNVSTLSTAMRVSVPITQKEILDTTSTLAIDVSNDLIAEKANIESNKIKSGVTLFGVTGTLDAIPNNTTRLEVGNQSTLNTNTITIDESYFYITYTSSTRNILAYVNAPIILRADNENVAETIGLTADKIKKDETILGIVGTFAGDSGTDDATAEASDIIKGKTAYVKGNKVEGTLSVISDSNYRATISNSQLGNSYISITSSNVNQSYSNGLALKNSTIEMRLPLSTIVSLIGLTPNMIAEGVTVLGVEGTHTGSGVLTEEEYAQCEAVADAILGEEVE